MTSQMSTLLCSGVFNSHWRRLAAFGMKGGCRWVRRTLTQMEPATQGDLFDYLLTVLRESGLAGRGPGEGLAQDREDERDVR